MIEKKIVLTGEEAEEYQAFKEGYEQEIKRRVDEGIKTQVIDNKMFIVALSFVSGTIVGIFLEYFYG